MKMVKYLMILSGTMMISLLYYVNHPVNQLALHPQSSSKIKDEFLYEYYSNTKNISAKIKNLNTSEDNTLIGTDAVHDLSPKDISDLSPEDERPQPSVVPVTSNKEECLPVIKGLQVEPIKEQECQQPHVLMNGGGRLGNQLCQYASLYILRYLFGIRVTIKRGMKNNLSLTLKNISIPVQEDSECFSNNMTNIKYDAMYMKLYNAAMETRNKTTNLTIAEPLLNESYYVYNNPGPRALLMDYRDLVHTIFRFKDGVISNAIKKIDGALVPYNATYHNRDFQIVTVHVRRSDYTGYLKGKFRLEELDNTYFQKAFDFYKKRLKRPVFLVLSDDLPWCRINLETQDVIISDWGDATTDMVIMSLGDHHITSYGTFSFMGALLGHGHITHPMGHNRFYNLVDCVNSPYFHYISRDKTYEIDNSHVKLL